MQRRLLAGLFRGAVSLGALLNILLWLAPAANALTCSVGGASGSYGAVDILSGSTVTTTTTFNVSCSGSANQTAGLCVQLGQGSPNSNTSIRYLGVGGAGTNTITHEIFSDSAMTVIWGAWGYNSVAAYATSGVAFNLSLGPTGNASHTFTVYGRLNGGQQTAIPGSYSWTTATPNVSYQSGSTTCASAPSSSVNAGSGATTWTATISANCNIGVSTMNFGSVSSISANIDSTATITAQCTNTTPYSIGLNNGANASGSQNRMRLGATTNYINYEIYTDSARTHLWSTTTSTTSCTGGTSTCVLATGTGSNQTVTIYGRVPAQSLPAAGTFTDTVVVTVTF